MNANADFSLEEEYMFGSLCITIDCLKGLKYNAGLDQLYTFCWKYIYIVNMLLV